MGKIKRIGLAVSLVMITLIGVYLAIQILASLMQGYSWHEMDWRQRGHTSIGDFFAASNIGKREAVQDGKKCVEYFSYKDGLPVKMICAK